MHMDFEPFPLPACEQARNRATMAPISSHIDLLRRPTNRLGVSTGKLTCPLKMHKDDGSREG